MKINKEKMSKCMKKIEKIVKENDMLAPSIKTELHIDDDLSQKTWWGSFITIAILVSILYICVRNGIILVTNKRPFLS